MLSVAAPSRVGDLVDSVEVSVVVDTPKLCQLDPLLLAEDLLLQLDLEASVVGSVADTAALHVVAVGSEEAFEAVTEVAIAGAEEVLAIREAVALVEEVGTAVGRQMVTVMAQYHPLTPLLALVEIGGASVVDILVLHP